VAGGRAVSSNLTTASARAMFASLSLSAFFHFLFCIRAHRLNLHLIDFDIVVIKEPFMTSVNNN